MISPDTIVAVGNSQILVSTDGGSTWTSEPLGNWWFNSVSFINNKTGMAVNDGGEIYKTIDGGFNWTKLNSGVSNALESIKMVNKDTIVAVGSNLIVVRSTDGGSTWNSQTLPGVGYWLEGVSFTNNNNGMIVGYNGYAFLTTDGGNTWNTMGNFSSNLLFNSVSYIGNGTAYIVGENGIIYKTTDNGTTWSSENSGTFNTLNCVSFINPYQGWAVGEWGTILHTKQVLQVKSPNGGEFWVGNSIYNITWSNINVSNIKIEYSSDNGSTWNTIVSSYPADSGSYSWHVPNINSSRCLVKISSVSDASINDISDNEFTISMAKGTLATWILDSNPSPVTAQHVTATNMTVNGTLSIKDYDGGAMSGAAARINNGTAGWGGESWYVNDRYVQFSASPMPGYSIQVDSVAYLMGCYGTHGGMHAATYWDTNVNFANKTLLELDSSSTGLVDVRDEQNGRIHDTCFAVNKTISSVGTFYLRFYPWYSAGQSESKYLVVWFVRFYGTVLLNKMVITSPNGGEDWFSSTSHNITWNGTSVGDTKIELTTDNGANWKTITSTVPPGNDQYEWEIGSYPLSKECLIRISDVNNPANTDISNSVFTLCPNNNIENNNAITLLSPNGNEKWKGGTTQYIVFKKNAFFPSVRLEYTTDNGNTWNQILDEPLSGLTFYPWKVPLVNSDECKVRVSNWSNANMKAESMGTFSISTSTELANYPNPFNPSTIIRFNLDKKENVKIRIYNSLGQQVTELVNKEMNKGIHEVKFDASDLSSGVYFYVLSVGNKQEVKKMLYLK